MGTNEKVFVIRQFFETYDIINYSSGRRKGVVELELEIGLIPVFK